MQITPKNDPLWAIICFIWLCILQNGRGALITAADHAAVPEGAKIQLTGSGLTGLQRASFRWLGSPTTQVNFTAISDTRADVTFTARQSIREHVLLLETTTGATVTLGAHQSPIPGNVVDFTTVGSYIGGGAGTDILIVKTGAVLKGAVPFSVQTVYVEAGGSVELQSGSSMGYLLFAEAGSTLDFRNSGIMWGGEMIYYTPTTQMLGQLPGNTFLGMPTSRQLPALTKSLNVGPFTLGVALGLSIAGNGTVAKLPEKTYYRPGEVVQLTAHPAEGHLFSGWSGAVSSVNPSITTNAGSSNPITATFSSGRVLTTFSGLGGSITRTPDAPNYPVGTNVTLQAVPAAGYEFLGWSGGATGAAVSTAIIMDADKTVLGSFRPTSAASQTIIDSTDYEAVPSGTPIRLTGTGFASPQRATFMRKGQDTLTTFTVISNTQMDVNYNTWQESRDHLLLLETPQGSTVSLDAYPGGSIAEFSGVGTYDASINRSSVLIVKPGSILQSIQNTPNNLEAVYVEAGAYLKFPGTNGFSLTNSYYLFAEDGAILDFSDQSGSGGRFSTWIFPSPQTQILGQVQGPAPRQVTSLSRSMGIGPFTVGHALNVLAVGDGAVMRNPDKLYFKAGDQVQLSAVPHAGSSFSNWSGASQATTPDITLTLPVAGLLTANFSNQRTLTSYSGLGGTIIRNPDAAGYPVNTSVELTAQPAAGYEFIGWSGEATGLGTVTSVTMNSNKIVLGSFRQLDQSNVPVITATDFKAVPVGTPIHLSGTALTNPLRATFLWAGQNSEAIFAADSATAMEVTFRSPQPFRNHLLLIETSGGSTVTLNANATPSGGVVEFTGVGTFHSNAGLDTILVVKSGSILQGVTGFGQISAIYVEAGALLQFQNNSQGVRSTYLFGENGSILDFRNFSSPGIHSGSWIFPSPGTQILGPMPGNLSGVPSSRQIPSLGKSTGVGPFTEAYRVTTHIVGPGTISRVLKPFYNAGETLDLTALPTGGAHFVRWIGTQTTGQAQLTLPVRHHLELTARFSTLVDFVSQWRLKHFTTAQLALPEISGLDADPDADGLANTAEYLFGGDPLTADNPADVQFTKTDPDGKTVEITYQRPQALGDADYRYFMSNNGTTWLQGAELVDVIITEKPPTLLPDNQEQINVRFQFQGDFPAKIMFRIGAVLR